ncbi:MAG: N-acetylmuramoyl-L-alanine amidase [Janthinobacterium lividum]
MAEGSRYNQLAIVTRTLPIFVLCASTAACAQQPIVLLDPARGGAENGVRIADRLPEKQVTLDLAGRLASLLRARGFTVALTRETDIDVSNDARAAMANNLHPIACILLHAAAAGSGVHLYTSALHGKFTRSAVRWDDAQAAYVDRSRALADDLKSALERSRITASSGRTWMRPLDNMQCPAVAVEVAPEKDGTGAEDRTYQGQVANALANTLLLWRGKAASMAPQAPIPVPVAPTPVTPSTAPPANTTSAPATGGSSSSTSVQTTARPATPKKPAPAPVVRVSAAPDTQPDRTEP